MSLNTYPYSPFPASTEQLHRGDNEDLQAQIDAIKDGTEIDSFGDVETALGVVTADITDLEIDKTDTAVIAPDFDAEAGVYAVGDLVMYQGKLYEFTAAHETAGAWDSTEVAEKTVADEIDTVKSGLNNFKHIMGADGVTNAYAGDVDNLVDTGVYWCSNATNLPSAHWYVVMVFAPYVDASGRIPAQIAICYNAANIGAIYSRIKGGDGWSTWSRLNPT